MRMQDDDRGCIRTYRAIVEVVPRRTAKFRRSRPHGDFVRTGCAGAVS